MNFLALPIVLIINAFLTGVFTKLDVLFSDETGFPCGGYDIANYVNGK